MASFQSAKDRRDLYHLYTLDREESGTCDKMVRKIEDAFHRGDIHPVVESEEAEENKPGLWS